jgi:DNA topoisomerase I
MGATKYVFLSASSSFKGKSDEAKYEKARRLKKHIDKIREHYEKLLTSDDDFERQSGTAMWIIDRLALRVGGEKDEDEADTVGCCSLRVEHMTFPSDHEVTLDFLGKDSMRYHQTIDLERYGSTGKQVLKNLRRFTEKKKKHDDVFDYLTPSRLNEQLDELMPGLSAKVFRTYNASITLERELEDLSAFETPNAEKVLEYNRANREVAILCNHQRSVPKAFEKTWTKLTEKEALMVKQIEALEGMVASVKKGTKVTLKSDYDQVLAEAKKAAESKKKASASSAGAGAAAASAAEGGDAEAEETPEETVKRVKEEESHLFAKQPSNDEVSKRLTLWRDKLEKHRLDMRNKDDNKAVALGTSKINYMDPRITVAWCKRVELPIDKVFPKTLRDKFPWAMGVDSKWRF